MLALLPISAIVGYSFALKRYLSWPIEVIPFFVAAVFILVLYFATFASLLPLASLLIILTGNIFLLCSPLFINKQNLWNEYLTPGIIFLLVFICFFGLIARHFLATDWDEIYIWLPQTRLLYLHHNFWNAADTIFNKDYSPGGALFHYLFLRLGKYSEGQIYFAHSALFLIPTITLLRKYTWKNWQEALLFYCIFLLTLHFLFHIKMLINESLLMDGIVAVFFGSILSSYYVLQNYKHIATFLIIPASVLVLLKPLSFPFLLIIVAVIFVDQLLFAVEKKISRGIACLAFLIIPFFVISTWQHYVTHHFAVSNQWSLYTLLTTIKTVGTHSHLISSELFYRYLSALMMPILFMLVMYIFLYFIGRNIPVPLTKKRFWCAHNVLALGYITYLLGLLFIYFFMMPHLMLLQMNSFVRFINIYCIAWLMVALTHLLYSTEQITLLHKVPHQLATTFVAIFVTLLAVPLFISLHVSHERFVAKDNNQYIRYAIHQQLTGPINNLINSNNSKVGILWQGWGLMRFIIALDLLPRYSYFLNSQSPLAQLNQMDYIISNKKLLQLNKFNISLYNGTFAQLDLCADDKLNSVNTAHCTIQKVPFYIYKVNHYR